MKKENIKNILINEALTTRNLENYKIWDRVWAQIVGTDKFWKLALIDKSLFYN